MKFSYKLTYKQKLMGLLVVGMRYSDATQHIQWLVRLETKQEGCEN